MTSNFPDANPLHLLLLQRLWKIRQGLFHFFVIQQFYEQFH